MSDAGRPRALFVDDDPRVLSAIVRSLRREPFQVETAADARKALARLEEQTFALVVSDHRMPGLTGIEFLRRVRERWPLTRRILLSGWSSEIPRSDLEAANLFRLLAKPWDDAEFRSVVREAVEASGAAATDLRTP